MLALLKIAKQLNYDLKNPTICCPIDLRFSHDLVVKRLYKLRKARDLKNKKLEARKDLKEYIEKKMLFFNLFFKQKNITIEPLKSVNDFIIEGDIMRNCVFTSNYYKKEESLILSAKVNGERKETIEVNLKTFKIIQAYGQLNKKTKFNKKIKEIVNSKMDAIKSIQLSQAV